MKTTFLQFKATGGLKDELLKAIEFRKVALKEYYEIVNNTIKELAFQAGCKDHPFSVLCGSFTERELWTQCSVVDAKKAPKFLKKDGTPKLSTREGRWLDNRMKESRDKIRDTNPLDKCNISTLYLLGCKAYLVNYFVDEGEVYIYGVPKEGNDLTNNMRSETHPDMLEVSEAEWLRLKAKLLEKRS